MDRVTGDRVPVCPPASRLERAARRSWHAARRSHRPRGAGAPGGAARAGAGLPVRADVPHDPVVLACPALGVGPLVWGAYDHHLTLGGGAGAGAVAPHRPLETGTRQRPDGRRRCKVAQDPWALARLVCRLGCGYRATGPGGPAALTKPMGLALARTPTAPAQKSAPGAHHGWGTSLCGPGAGGHARLVSLASPTEYHPLVAAALYRSGGDHHAQAGDEKSVADPRYTHGPPPTGAPARARANVGSHHVEHPGRGQGAAAHLQRGPYPAALDHHCHCTLLPGLPAVRRDSRRLSLGAQRHTALLLFFGVYVCTQRASTGQAPIAVIVPETRSMPLYRLINDPFRALQERGDVKREAKMADLLCPQEAAASMLCGDTMQRSL